MGPEDVENDTIDAAEEEKPEGEGTTLAPEDAGMHEFDCFEFTDAELAFADPNQIPLQCRLRPKEGGEPKTVYILIPKQGLDLTRLFDKCQGGCEGLDDHGHQSEVKLYLFLMYPYMIIYWALYT